MKLMSYNIFDGAVKTLPQVIKIVNKESPDYLTLNEANTFADSNNKILREFANQTNFPYFDIALSGKMDYHVAVFSKYAFKKVVKLQPLERACLIALIHTEIGELSIASLHLTPLTEDARYLEINQILSFQEKYKNKVLMGDMNSLSRYDDYNEEIIKDFNEIRLKKYTANGKFRFDSIDNILSHGYFDAALEFKKNKEYTAPTLSNKDAAHSGERIDYIFLSGSLVPRLKNYFVFKNSLTDQTSDHYPIAVELK